ncbi:MAG: sulfite exporter TauE/SafE family protein [Candidatus Woesearchaeota archaeon]
MADEINLKVKDYKTSHKFLIEGTHCSSCAEIIKRQAMKVDGVEDFKFDTHTETAEVTYDNKKTSINKIFHEIERKGYQCYNFGEKEIKSKANQTLGWIFGLAGLAVLAYFFFSFADKISMPQITQNMGYGLLFVVGLLTGFHCISMCGGFVVSYTAKEAQEGKSSYKSHLKYGIAKTLSYTFVGAMFGLLGSIIAFTPMIRGAVGILAGMFLILFGLKMLNVIPMLRKFQFKTPKFVTKRLGNNSNPIIIGLLNGLMIACGPLQAIYIMAAGTGSMIEGAKMLLIFGLGTLPVMLGFGFLTSYISHKATQKILKASGVIIIILGLIMLNNGLSLAGTGYDVGSLKTSLGADKVQYNSGSAQAGAVPNNVAVQKDGYQEIRMDVLSSGWDPNTFVLKKGVPVRWIINGKQITGCNNAIQVPKYGLEFKIKQGEQTIEFTPNEEGVVSWSCWMGMIKGTFVVKNDISNTDSILKEVLAAKPAAGGSCGGGGGCGCGMM